MHINIYVFPNHTVTWSFNNLILIQGPKVASTASYALYIVMVDTGLHFANETVMSVWMGVLLIRNQLFTPLLVILQEILALIIKSIKEY